MTGSSPKELPSVAAVPSDSAGRVVCMHTVGGVVPEARACRVDSSAIFLHDNA